MKQPAEMEQVEGIVANPAGKTEQSDDGTRALLMTGFWTLAAGVLAAILAATVFGGISRQGPHTNAGWLSLMVALMCLPFGVMLFGLGFAKWLRSRKLRRQGLR
jgi:F0F1-type ATP synthase membrane subunit c/vacuolar-type H+-ATPase subunit K